MRLLMPLTAFLPLSGAFSWAHIPLWKEDAPQGLNGIEDRASPDEVALILGKSESFDRYSTKPDCFRQAAAAIRAGCAELETREDERVKAALSLTLCEIATAERQSPPMECAAFRIVGNDEQPPHYADGSPGKCVEALSRSAQYWSSYSGYLREVPQLCFALRRWNDIDTAKELYHNSTSQNLALLQYLANRERIYAQDLKRSESIVEGMHAVLGELHSSTAAINITTDSISEQLRLTLGQISNTFRDVAMGIGQELREERTAEMDQVQSSVGRAIDDLTAASLAVAPTIQTILVHNIEKLYSSMDIRLQGMDKLSERVNIQLTGFEHELVALHREVHALIGVSQQANIALAAGVQDSLVAHEKQLDLVQASTDVALALGDIVNKAHAEMQNINGTAAAMKESLLKDVSGNWHILSWSWLEAASIYCVRTIWKVDSLPLDIPAFRGLCLFARVVWSLLGMASSGLMSVLVLIASRTLFTGSHRTTQPGDAFPDTHSPRVRSLGSLAATQSLGSICTVPSSKDSDYALTPTTAPSRERRPRVSRIPDRLYRPSGSS